MIVKSSEFGVNSQKLQYFYGTKPLQNCTNTMVVFWLKSASTAKTIGLLQPHLGYLSCMLVTLRKEISKLKKGLRNSSTDILRWWLASTLWEASLSWSMVATTHACNWNSYRSWSNLITFKTMQHALITLWVVTKTQNTRLTTNCSHHASWKSFLSELIIQRAHSMHAYMVSLPCITTCNWGNPIMVEVTKRFLQWDIVKMLYYKIHWLKTHCTVSAKWA